MQSEYLVIGLMSGTSLDGLDIAACKFNFVQGKWSYELLAAETITYSNELVMRLRKANDCSGFELSLLDVDLGKMHGEWVASFIERFDLKPDLIASHGHTIFHRPELGLTLQIGSAAHITAQTGIQTISNFRTIDVALGGQGAPLVPIGDRLLFSEYDACLNLGGIANISFEESGKRIAFDIVPCNMVFNEIALLKGLAYDEGGSIARSGRCIQELFERWNALDFYSKEAPKSLGREYFEEHYIREIGKGLLLTDIMATAVEHAVYQIAKIIQEHSLKNVLVTGGGAHNDFLIGKLREETTSDIVIPDSKSINFKEAIVFAFLGALRIRGEINALSSVTGARIDSVGGFISQI
jgi:anhydro-N-acetylmuramic acid kinase